MIFYVSNIHQNKRDMVVFNIVPWGFYFLSGRVFFLILCTSFEELVKFYLHLKSLCMYALFLFLLVASIVKVACL